MNVVNNTTQKGKIALPLTEMLPQAAQITQDYCFLHYTSLQTTILEV